MAIKRSSKPAISVIISNRNDVAMMAVTVRSCIEEFQAFPADQWGEIVICDNSDEPIFENLKAAIPYGYVRDGTVKILRQDFPCLFTARETAIKAAKSDYVMCLDSHMLCGHRMIAQTVGFLRGMEDDPTLGFVHQPISWAHQHERVARHDRDMSEHELGAWGTAYKQARTITWKGMPWACRRKWFLSKDGLNGYGALSEHKLSWGGGDMHIGIKPWLLGYKNWGIPTRPGIHIGPFPKTDMPKGDPNSTIVGKAGDGYKYRLWGKSGHGPHTIGFLVACYVIGGIAMMNRNKDKIIKRFGRYIDVDEWWDRAIAYGQNEKKWLKANQKMTFEQLLKRRPWDA